MVRRWFACLALVLAVSVPAQQQEVGNFDDDDLQSLVVELQPVVEKVCGRKFHKPPVAVLADSGDLMRVFRIELEPQVASFFQGQPAARIRRALQLRADTIGQSAIGKFAFDSGKVLIVPQRILLNLQVLGLQEADHLAVLKLFVAHELVHALQQQEMPFGKRYAAMTDAGAIDSLSMRTEGHAVMCAEMVLRELGLAPAIATGRAIVSGSSQPLQDLGALLDRRRGRCRGALLYLTGADLMYEAHTRGGVEEVWRMVRGEGPVAELLRPALPLPPIRNLQACFDGIDAQLGGRTWCVGRGALSEIQLLSENYAERDELTKLMAKCHGAAHWEGSGATPLLWRSAKALRFEDTTAATKFRELAQRCATKDLSLATKSAAVCEPGLGLPGASSSVVRQDYAGQRAELHWFQRDEHVLQFTLVKAPLAEDVLLLIAEQVLQALAN